MRKPITSIALITGLIIGMSPSIASPGPNGKNNHGLCTAFFNGSQIGMDNKRGAPPFAELSRQAGDADGNGTPGQPTDVWAWCLSEANNPKGIGGNPTNPDGGTAPGGGGGGGSTAQTSSKGGKKK